MGDPRRLRPDEVEILVARELRKAGVMLSQLPVLARRAASSSGADDYSIELAAVLGDGDVRREAVIECRNEGIPTTTSAVQTLAARRSARAKVDEPRRLYSPLPATPAIETDTAPAAPRLAIMFSTSGYEPDAVRHAASLGVALFAIADGIAAFRRSQWAVGTQPPAWVPEYMAELVDLDSAGAVRHRMLVPGIAKLFPAR